MGMGERVQVRVFGLDALPNHDLEELNPQTIVVNPCRRLYEQARRTLAENLARIRTVPAERLAR